MMGSKLTAMAIGLWFASNMVFAETKTMMIVPKAQTEKTRLKIEAKEGIQALMALAVRDGFALGEYSGDLITQVRKKSGFPKVKIFARAESLGEYPADKRCTVVLMTISSKGAGKNFPDESFKTAVCPKKQSKG